MDEGDDVRLLARAADAEGQDLQYRWTQVSGTPVTLEDPESLQPSFRAPEGLVNSDLVFQLEASDGTNTVTDTVVVTVAADDDAPRVTAGADQQVEESQSVQLDARAEDPEGRPLRYQWTQLEGPTVRLTGDDAASPAFTAPNLASDQDLVFQVEVTDGTHVTTDTVTVSVLANDDTPDIDAGRALAAAADIEQQDTGDEALEEMRVLDPMDQSDGRVEVNATPASVLVSDTLDRVLGGEIEEEIREAFDDEGTDLDIDRPAVGVDAATLAIQRTGRFEDAFDEGAPTIPEVDPEPGVREQATEEEPQPETRGQSFLAGLWSLLRLSGGSKRVEAAAETSKEETRQAR